MTEYYLFGTQGCHLCEQAEQLLEQYDAPVNYQKKEITENQDWLNKYVVRIPVLHHIESRQDLDWPFDNEALKSFIQQHRIGLLNLE